jgi:hypothetical protein
VLAKIVQDMSERIPHYARRLQFAREKAIGPDLARTPHEGVHRPRDTNRQALHAA